MFGALHLPARRRGTRPWFAWPVLLCVLLLGCGRDPSNPGPGPYPGPGDDPQLEILQVSDPLAFDLHPAPPDWTDDDRWILTTSAPGSIVRKHLASDPDSSRIVTTITGFDWLNAGYTPFGMHDGAIGYFQGLLLSEIEPAMHVMVADSLTVEGEPAATVLRRFKGPVVGLPQGQISSPSLMSCSADGSRAVGTWQGTWLLEWADNAGGGTPAMTVAAAPGLVGSGGYRLDRSGTRLAYVDAEGRVLWMPFGGDEASRTSPGSSPSFSGDGRLLGYLSPSGTDYIVLDTFTNRTTLYAGSGEHVLVAPVLSWGGDRVAFLEQIEGRWRLGVAALRP